MKTQSINPHGGEGFPHVLQAVGRLKLGGANWSYTTSTMGEVLGGVTAIRPFFEARRNLKRMTPHEVSHRKECIMAQPVVHFEIGARDMDRACDFYKKLFNWEIQKAEGMPYGMVAPGCEGSIGGGIGPLPEGMAPYVTVYVQVDDLQKSLDSAEKLSGKTLMPPTPIPGVGSCAWLADPDGVAIGLYKPLRG